jgi:hypothetical protein
MDDAGEGSRLAAEPPPGALGLAGVGPDALERDPAVEPLVVAFVDLPHAAAAETAEEAS